MNNNAFSRYEEIDKLSTLEEKQKAWLEDYKGLMYSRANNKIHFIKWKDDPHYYNPEEFSYQINLIGRLKNRLIIEFDEVKGEPKNPQEALKKVEEKLKAEGWGYIQSTHNSKNSDYLWVEFTRELTTKEAESFLEWICPEGSRIDLNFTSDEKVFPVLFARHWKYSQAFELPVHYHKGKKIDFDSLGIKTESLSNITLKTSEDGFTYKTYTKKIKNKGDISSNIREDYLDITKSGIFVVNVDKVSDKLIQDYKIKTIFGTKTEKTYAYEGDIYTETGRGIIKTECESLLGEYAKTKVVNEIFEKIKRKTSIDKEEFENTDKNLIPLKNGVWDIEGKRLMMHRPENNFTFMIPLVYDASATCPNWNKFIEEALYPEDIPTLQEWFGFMLYREYFIKKALICEGPRDTGKSVLLDTAIKFIGEKNKTGISLQKISSGSDFTKLSLKEKHLNVYDDLSSRDLNDGGSFKVATGGGYISGEEKFGEYSQFRSYAKQMFATNKIPPVKDSDDLAYFSRWIVLKFDNQPEKKDPFLRRKLWTEEELSGILNWALEGLYRLLKNGDFSYNKTPEQVKRIMEMSGDPLIQFGESCLKQTEGRVSKEEMYEIYSIWANENDKPLLSKEQLGRRLNTKIKYLVAKNDAKERYWDNVSVVNEWLKRLNNNKKEENNDTLDTIKKNLRGVNKSSYNGIKEGIDMYFLKASNPSKQPKPFTHEEINFEGSGI